LARRRRVQELAGDAAAGQTYHLAAVGQRRRADVDEHARAGFVADVLAAGEELVVEDNLVAQRELRVRVTDVVRLNNSGGLNATLKTSVFDLAGLGPSACDAAGIS